MIRSKLVFQRIALKLGLYGAFTAAYWLAYWLRFGPLFVPVRPDMRPPDYVLLYLVAALTWGALCRLAELDQLWMAANQARWLWGSVWVTAAMLMAIFFAAFFVRTYSFSRLFIILLGLLNIPFVMILPKLLLILAHRHSGPKADVRILIVGDGQCAERVAERVRENSWVPCKVVGYVAVG